MAEKLPLWKIPIPILGLTGEYASGKTLFGLTIEPGETTLIYDSELGSDPYQSLGFDRVDMAREMTAANPDGYLPKDLFLWWLDHMRSIEPGKYSVIVLDPVSEIESGLVEYVRSNPAEFGYTAGQFAKAEALVWGAVKDYWKRILSEIASRCETFVFTSHMRDEFRAGSPTRRRIPKGKETLMELATVYLQMDRSPDKKGNVSDIPSAIVLKSRLASFRATDDGMVETIPVLPPRLPKATPFAIREYMAKPPNFDKLSAGERLPEEREATAEELAEIAMKTAEYQRDAEAIRSDREARAEAAKAKRLSKATRDVNVRCEAIVTASPEPAEPPVVETPASQASVPDGLATAEQIERLKGYVGELAKHGFTMDNWRSVLEKYGVKRAAELSVENAEMIATKMFAKLNAARNKSAESEPPKN